MQEGSLQKIVLVPWVNNIKHPCYRIQIQFVCLYSVRLYAVFITFQKIRKYNILWLSDISTKTTTLFIIKCRIFFIDHIIST